MEEVKLKLDADNRGSFYVMDGAAQIGEMVISISDKNLTVYHTEVVKEAEGKGIAKKMLEAMTAYARSHQLKVIPLCPYVHAQFRRQQEAYADIWQKNSVEE
jgi:uncharacterized protein